MALMIILLLRNIGLKTTDDIGCLKEKNPATFNNMINDLRLYAKENIDQVKDIQSRNLYKAILRINTFPDGCFALLRDLSKPDYLMEREKERNTYASSTNPTINPVITTRLGGHRTKER